MAGGKGRIGFTLPEQRKPGRDSFDTKPRKVEAWIDDLPMGNVGETARQVFGALHETNRLRIGWKERYHLLEALRAPVSYLGQALKKRYTGLPFPLQPKTLRIAGLATDLYGEMALGYKIAIEDMLARSFLFRDRRILTIMLHRALRYLNRALLTSYQVYSPSRGEIWADLHRLYRYAEGRRLARSSVTDQEQAVLPKTSIATAYKQALLLALASPYRLRQGEVDVVHAALEIWAHLPQLLPYDPGADRNGPLFVTHLDSNDEPSHITFSQFSCDDGQCRLIDLERLTITVHDELDRVNAGTVTELKRRLGNSLTTDLLRRLTLTWGVPPKRGFSRDQTRTRADVVVGLSAVHRVLGELDTPFSESPSGREAAPTFTEAATFTSRKLRSTIEPKVDVWNPYQASPAPSQSPRPTVTPQKPAAPASLQIQTWDIHDESDGGYRVARSGSGTLGVHVGDLIGLRSPDAAHDNDWAIGVVRWFRHSGPDELQMGIQKISRHGSPSAARTRQPGGPYSEYQRVIGLPENGEQPQSLLVPAMLFSVGNTLLVPIDQQEHRLQLTGLLEATGSFAQFTYEDLGSAEASTRAKPEQRPGQPTDYSSLWTEL